MSEQPPATSTDEPAESGALEDEQQGKGYGQDEGEREQALEGEQRVPAPSQRRALGALFLLHAALFAGIAAAGASAGGGAWVIAATAAVLTAWLLWMAISAFRRSR